MKEGISLQIPRTLKIIKVYYEQLNVHKYDNPNEMDQFSERYNLSKLTQEEADNLNGPETIKLMSNNLLK